MGHIHLGSCCTARCCSHTRHLQTGSPPRSSTRSRHSQQTLGQGSLRTLQLWHRMDRSCCQERWCRSSGQHPPRSDTTHSVQCCAIITTATTAAAAAAAATTATAATIRAVVMMVVVVAVACEGGKGGSKRAFERGGNGKQHNRKKKGNGMQISNDHITAQNMSQTQ